MITANFNCKLYLNVKIPLSWPLQATAHINVRTEWELPSQRFKVKHSAKSSLGYLPELGT